METYELALLGESGVGKTALLHQLMYKSFTDPSYDSGLDVVPQTQLTVDDQLCILKFAELSIQVLRSGCDIPCHAFVLVYSVTQRSSFTQLERCYNDVIRIKRGVPKFILVGNDVDNNYQLEVTTDEGRQKARTWGCAFFETSAKTGLGVEEAFMHVVRELRGTVVEKPEAVKEPSCWSKCVIL